MNRIRLTAAAVLVTLSVSVPLAAQQTAKQTEPELLTLDTVFTYTPKSLGPLQWQTDGSGYLMLEPSASRKGSTDIVRYDAATGAKSIVVPADKLVPPGASAPLAIEEFDLSA